MFVPYLNLEDSVFLFLIYNEKIEKIKKNYE